MDKDRIDPFSEQDQIDDIFDSLIQSLYGIQAAQHCGGITTYTELYKQLSSTVQQTDQLLSSRCRRSQITNPEQPHASKPLAKSLDSEQKPGPEEQQDQLTSKKKPRKIFLKPRQFVLFRIDDIIVDKTYSTRLNQWVDFRFTFEMLLEWLHRYVQPTHPKYDRFLKCVSQIRWVDNQSNSFPNNVKYFLKGYFQCPTCFKPLSPGNHSAHLRAHQLGKIDLTNYDKLCIFCLPRFEDKVYFCPFADCNYETADQVEIRGHLGLYHTFQDLRKWGYRKDVLLGQYRYNLGERPCADSTNKMIQIDLQLQEIEAQFNLDPERGEIGQLLS